MIAHYERICEHAGILRIGSDGWQFGQPYLYSATVRVDGDVAWIEGLNAAEYGPQVRAPVAEALYKEGFAWARWRRHPGGRIIEFPTRRWAFRGAKNEDAFDPEARAEQPKVPSLDGDVARGGA